MIHLIIWMTIMVAWTVYFILRDFHIYKNFLKFEYRNFGDIIASFIMWIYLVVPLIGFPYVIFQII